MATLLRTVVDDVATSLSQIFDDKQIQKTQVAHWIIQVGNRLKAAHIGKRDSGAFLSIWAGIPIQTVDTTTNPNSIAKRKHIILPTSIFDYDKDGGIEYIAYYHEDDCGNEIKRIFTRTTPSDLQRIKMSRYEKPSPTNPFWYRAHEYIYLEGIECISPKFLEIGIYSTLTPITDPDIDLDGPFDFPEELLIQLTRQVIDLARFVLMIPSERINDGDDQAQGTQMPTAKLTSVNELNEDVPQNK